MAHFQIVWRFNFIKNKTPKDDFVKKSPDIYFLNHLSKCQFPCLWVFVEYKQYYCGLWCRQCGSYRKLRENHCVIFCLKRYFNRNLTISQLLFCQYDIMSHVRMKMASDFFHEKGDWASSIWEKQVVLKCKLTSVRFYLGFTVYFKVVTFSCELYGTSERSEGYIIDHW